VVLTRSCQKALQQAEAKIRVLSKGADGELVERDFEAPDED
jgi:exonuclease VII small subunit